MRWPPPADWPNAHLSQQIFCKPHRWHVQQDGSGPTLILLHGAGGSVHSYRDVIPLLAQNYHVVAIDMPGQGLTQLGARHRCGLDPMAHDVAALIAQEGWEPAAIVGHSAGGALALRLSQLLPHTPAIIGINPALGHFQGLAGVLFPVMAKLLALTPGVAGFFSRSAANPDRVRNLIETTGTTLPDEGLALYRRLVGDRGHVDATLLMMAQWSLDDLLRDLPQITAPTLFLAAERDEAVPPSVAEAAAARMPNAQVTHLMALGHLAHEEDPAQIAQLITQFLATVTPEHA
ncbi:alpha/beta fold hydrolase BchO [Aestuariivita boseongensis]|uniref:alpha/beta fold hydrolase BchO n=1 Tax=Aestuariivita boseongensis TaxID=1470562 RepID=UPI00067FC456|nr:alpha/beta fold hydrolase BchO [Aestuariivita boseongensis]